MAFAVGHQASEKHAGAVKLASTEEAAAGTNTTKAVTPAGVLAAIEANTDIDARLLGVVFDGTNAAGTRTYGAANKTFTRSTDASAGTDTFAENPIFRGYYALVKLNSTTQKAEIIAKEGTAEYASIKAAGTEDYDEVRMFHVFWYKQTISSDGKKTIVLSPMPLEGFKPSPMHYRNGLLHEWVGITRYPWGKDADATGGMAAKTGLYPLTNTTEATFYTNAKARGLRIFGAREFSSLQLLGNVKYANQNWQSAVAAGYTNANVNAVLREDTAGTNTAVIDYSASNAQMFAVGRTLSFVDRRVADNVRNITAIDTEYDTTNNYMKITFDGAVAPTMTAGTDKIYAGLAKNGTGDSIQGLDGYASSMHSSEDKCTGKYLGIENLFGNMNKACSGIVRYDGSIWIKDDPDGDNTWLTTSDQTGWTRACPSYDNSAGYINKFNPTENMGEYDWLSSPSETGGTSSAPIGDYIWSNTTTNTVYMIGYGGPLSLGAGRGPFFWDAYSRVATASWDWGALGVFIPDL